MCVIDVKNEKRDRESREQPYAYWLHAIPGIGNKTICKLLEAVETAENLYAIKETEIQHLLTQRQFQTFVESKTRWDVYREYEKLQTANISFFPRSHSLYPEKLKVIPDAPYALYVKGELPRSERVQVAVIGARLASEYGRYLARQFGMKLARAGIEIVSGMASGIDGISQKAALEAGERSFAVLGSGVDIYYPEENRKLYEALKQQGGILSEYIPGTLPKASNFPPRNRIISGLSDAVLVIEARQKSGTLITVDMALEQGKDVYVIPGRITDTLSQGCNRLIKQGAGVILSPEELIEELQAVNKTMIQKTDIKEEIMIPESKRDCMILRQLDYLPQTVDTIFEKIRFLQMGKEMTIPQLLQELLHLQMKGYVAQTGGQYYLCGKAFTSENA